MRPTGKNDREREGSYKGLRDNGQRSAHFPYMPWERRITLILEGHFDKKKLSCVEKGNLACYIRGAPVLARFVLPAL